MIVIFSSQCQKKAIARTCRILDSFANRIGTSTWKTVITNEGLLAVKKLLRKSATKNTAVACHVIHGKSSMELIWIVGNRNCFNREGIIPVHYSNQETLKEVWENDWNFHPVVQSLVAISALLHDVGKANDTFQRKLTSSTRIQQDPLRHEFVSCIFVVAMARLANAGNITLLEYLEKGVYDIDSLIALVKQISIEAYPFQNLPDYWFCIIWLIIGHHKLPIDEDYKRWKDISLTDINTFKKILSKDWAYHNTQQEMQNLVFSKGIVMQSSA